MIAMSTALKRTNPFKTLFGYALVRDEKGEEMHKSKGNSIEFNEAADQIGADVMRWMYMTQNPEINLNFGFNVAADIKRRFYLIFWNCYKFFVDYAFAYDWRCDETPTDIKNKLTILDRWVLARLTEVTLLVNEKMETLEVATATRAIEEFIVNDFSTWYIRRSRDRVGPEAEKEDRETSLTVMYGVLVTLTKFLAPYVPFITEVMYRNLTDLPSVHLADYPKGDETLLDDKLVKDMIIVRKLAEATHAKRKEAGIKLRQPLGALVYEYKEKLDAELEKLLAEEVNVKIVEYNKTSVEEPKVKLDTKLTQELEKEGKVRELIRSIQQLRKEANLTLNDKTKIMAPNWPEKYEKAILAGTASVSITKSRELKVEKV